MKKLFFCLSVLASVNAFSYELDCEEAVSHLANVVVVATQKIDRAYEVDEGAKYIQDAPLSAASERVLQQSTKEALSLTRAAKEEISKSCNNSDACAFAISDIHNTIAKGAQESFRAFRAFDVAVKIKNEALTSEAKKVLNKAVDDLHEKRHLVEEKALKACLK